MLMLSTVQDFWMLCFQVLLHMCCEFQLMLWAQSHKKRGIHLTVLISSLSLPCLSRSLSYDNQLISCCSPAPTGSFVCKILSLNWHVDIIKLMKCSCNEQVGRSICTGTPNPPGPHSTLPTMLMQRAARPPRAVPVERRMEILWDAYSNSTFTGARRMKRDGGRLRAEWPMLIWKLIILHQAQ